MSFTFVQKLPSQVLGGGSPLQSGAMSSNPTIGNYLFCTISGFTSSTGTPTVSDTTGGNTWILAKTLEQVSAAGNLERASVFYCLVAATGASFKVSASSTGATPETLFQVEEFSVAPGSTVAIDTPACASGVAGNVTTSLTITGSTTAAAGELIFGVLAAEGSFTTAGISDPCNFNGSTTGVTSLAFSNDDSSIEGGQHSYVIASSAGTATSFNWTYTTDAPTYAQYVAVSAAFKEIAAPAQIVADIISGSRRNRPGRGPYSLGVYHRPIGELSTVAPNFAALASTPTAVATVTAALTTSIQLAAALSSVATLAATFIRSSPMSLPSWTTLGGASPVSSPIAATLQSSATITANFGTGAGLTAALSSSSTITAILFGTGMAPMPLPSLALLRGASSPQQAFLFSSPSAVATLTATLSPEFRNFALLGNINPWTLKARAAANSGQTSIPLAATLNAVSIASPTLTTRITLAAAVSSSATCTGSLSVANQLSATPTAQATVTADLTTAIVLAAALQEVSALAADLTVSHGAFTANLNVISTTVATLTTGIPLGAALSVTHTVAADLTNGIVLTSQAKGQASVTASLTTSITMAAALVADAEFSATPSVQTTLIAVLAIAQAQVSASLTTQIRLACTLQAVATVSLSTGTFIMGNRNVWRVPKRKVHGRIEIVT